MLKLLAVGDLHLGRRPPRVPDALAAADPDALTPVGALRRIVAQAIKARVDVVAFAGDVVDRDDDFFEAFAVLHVELQRLVDAGIRVLGVAGNHDVEVLPRLAARLPDFHLLGAGGRWEQQRVEAGGETLTLHGWSFPQPIVEVSPLEGRGRFERGPGVNLGLLHCDRDAGESRYAPVRRAELEAAGLDGWLLGHIHKPDALTAAAPNGYLGSVIGMNPSEQGAHGPWLLSLEGGRITRCEQWVLAPLRWQRTRLDVTAVDDPEAAPGALLDHIRELDRAEPVHLQAPIAVGLRVTLIGRTRRGREMHARLMQDRARTLFNGGAGAAWFLEWCYLETRPVQALDELARRKDPIGLLAAHLLRLDDAAQDPSALFAGLREPLERLRRDSRWAGLRAEGRDALDALDDAALRAYLRRAGSRLLEAMLAQSEERH